MSQDTQPEFPVTVALGPSGYTSRVRAGGHDFVADEPESVGGADQGPGPYELLLASLGACTVMTLRMYAERKRINLTGAEVDLRHDRVHAEDCEDCETKEGRIDHIYRRIRLRGDLTDEQRKRLMEIADKCPVHRTLSSEIRIRSEMQPLD
ncbi:MAG: OsmC family protein [Planctomycetota bacterium]|nr:OsmC family protein [Planctomycetota bacterium]